MVDYRVRKLADLVVTYSTNVKDDDVVGISGTYASLPLIKELVRSVLLAGGNPVVRIVDEELEEIFYKYASEKQLGFISKVSRFFVEDVDVRISIISSTHTKHLSSVPPDKIKTRLQAARELTEIFMRRDKEGSLRWNVVPFPTKALAQDAEMSFVDYEDFVYSACKVNLDDSVEAWMKQAKEQDRIIGVLKKVSEIRIISSDTDLYLRVDGRTWINDDGKKNMPGGEVFTGPIEDSVEGYITFTYPAIWRGIIVEGVRLEFMNGVVVHARASRNEEYLRSVLDTDEGAKRVGEFAFGLNFGINKFTKNILFDEKIGGTIHIALGAGYPATGSENRSSIHWDMIKDMKDGKIYADGELIYENGKFLV